MKLVRAKPPDVGSTVVPFLWFFLLRIRYKVLPNKNYKGAYG